MAVIKTTTLADLVVLLAHFATLKAGQPDDGLAEIASSDAVAVAAQVDQLLDASFSDQGVTPTEIARDEDFLRRVCLDLAGRIVRHGAGLVSRTQD